jgi:hypothetical protein
MKTIKMVSIVAAIFAAVLLVSGSAMAFSISGGAITVGASDLVANQSSTDMWGDNFSGYNYRFSYSTNVDKYAQNSNFTSPVLSGWSSAVYQNNNCTLLNAGGYTAVERADRYASDSGSFIYKFDLSGTGDTISKLDLTTATSVWTDGGASNSVYWYVSTDGSSWTNYLTVTATTAGGGFAGSGAYYDVSSVVAGHNVFYVKEVMTPYWSADCDEAFRSGGYGDWGTFDAKLTLVPEPGSLLALLTGIVGLGGFAVRRRK